MMYDFDKTLCTKDMQEYSFIPRVNMSSDEFWDEVTRIGKEENMDLEKWKMLFIILV